MAVTAQVNSGALGKAETPPRATDALDSPPATVQSDRDTSHNDHGGEPVVGRRPEISKGKPLVRLAMKRGVFVVVMLAALVFAGPAAPSPPASSADEATAYQLDATHDGSIADAGLSAPLTQAWSITLPSAPSYPLIADGMVFVTSPYNGLYAINQATGSTIWSAATYGSTGLAYDRGQVFEWDRSGDLTAFDAATGTIDWSEPIGSNRSNDYGAAPTAVNGVVYVTGSYTVFAVRESDGKTLWTGSVSERPVRPPSPPQGRTSPTRVSRRTTSTRYQEASCGITPPPAQEEAARRPSSRAARSS